MNSKYCKKKAALPHRGKHIPIRTLLPPKDSSAGVIFFFNRKNSFYFFWA